MGCGGSSRRNSKKSGNGAAHRKKKISVRIGSDVRVLDSNPVVIFVFGGPGSKKGKLMTDLIEAFGFKLINIDRLMLNLLAKKMEISGSMDSVTRIADQIKVRGMFRTDPLDPALLDVRIDHDETPAVISLDVALMEIKKHMDVDPTGCYVIDMMPNLRFLVQSSELIKNPTEEMESFESEYPVSFAINFDNPMEKLNRDKEQTKSSSGVQSTVPATKSDEADFGRTKRRATLFQNSVRPYIDYFLHSDRLVNVDVSSGAMDLVWEKICSIFIDLNFKNRFNVNSVILFSFGGEHMDIIELGKYTFRNISLKEHLQNPSDPEEKVCCTLCKLIDSSEPTVEVFCVNLEGTSINKNMECQVEKRCVLFLQEENSFLHAQVALHTKSKDTVHFKAVSSTSNEVCLFPMGTDTELCKKIALMMAECRKNS